MFDRKRAIQHTKEVREKKLLGHMPTPSESQEAAKRFPDGFQHIGGWISQLFNFHNEVVASNVQLSRGIVSCESCKRREKVDAVFCLKHGWPKCCGYTMRLE